MTALRWMTAGESHGPMLVAILEGLPAGLDLTEELLRVDLQRRQQGYGRGGRMKIESDSARIVAGVRHGVTLGSPLALLIENRDHQKWLERMKVAPLTPGEQPGPAVTLPRPGHADLAGGIKYGAQDLRDILERASARETAARVALGGAARALLAALDIHVGSSVRSIHDAVAPPALISCPEAAVDARRLSEAADASPVRCADAAAGAAMVAAIEAAQRRRDTVGGTVEVVVSGLPAGLGSHVHWDRRLDARLVRALVSIHAIKAAEVGDGWSAASRYGTQVHDPILRGGDSAPLLERGSNHAGGTEGGITNGQPLVVRAAMKPIATVSEALPSVDLLSGEVDRAHVERSDTCAVPAAAVVAESMVALELASVLLEELGGDTLAQLRQRLRQQHRRARRLGGHLFLVGPPGSGKSTVGPLLAAELGLAFHDLDAAITTGASRSIEEIFSVDGEAAFRDLEQRTLEGLVRGPPAVIALGGGAVLTPEVRALLRRGGDVIWLRNPVETLHERLIQTDLGTRPLLQGEPLMTRLSTLEAQRRWLYERVADAMVDAAAGTDQVVQRIVGAWCALPPPGARS